MLSRMTLLLLFLLQRKVSAECTEIGPAVIKGKRFFDSRTGKYIPLKGINYYPRPNSGPLDVNAVDFFTDEHENIWRPDLKYLQSLNVNVIRIFAVDPSKSHDMFMCALKQLRIYVIVGLAASCDDCHIINDLAPPECYPPSLKSRGQFIINTFSRYDNTLAFSAGNEVNLESAYGQPVEYNAACQKQFLRDMRQFIHDCPLMRNIPVGLSVADIDRFDNALYYTCRSDKNDPLENAEFYGLNVYQHCNQGDPCLVGYQRMLSDFRDMALPIPVLLTEFGCVDPSFQNVGQYEAQRDFRQVPTLFSQEYAEHFAGALAFEYSTERWNAILAGSEYPFTRWGYGNYGVGYFSPADCNHGNTTCTYVPFPQFDNLAQEFSLVSASSIPDFDDYDPPQWEYPECPARFNDTLANIPWGSADVPDDGCAWWPTDLVCPNTPPECLNPTLAPTDEPLPSSSPTQTVSTHPTSSPTSAPSIKITPAPTTSPTPLSSESPSIKTPSPTEAPSFTPTQTPSLFPTTSLPSVVPGSPTSTPTTDFPTEIESQAPTYNPSTSSPTDSPTQTPTTISPTLLPSVVPGTPTMTPSTGFPSSEPEETSAPSTTASSSSPSQSPTNTPTVKSPTIPPILFLPTTTVGVQADARSGAITRTFILSQVRHSTTYMGAVLLLLFVTGVLL